MLEYYTLDTLLTLAFQKRCYINILNIICMERVNIFGQRIFFDHKNIFMVQLCHIILPTLFQNEAIQFAHLILQLHINEYNSYYQCLHHLTNPMVTSSKPLFLMLINLLIQLFFSNPYL